MQKIPYLTPIVTKISFPPFSARREPPTPKRGEDTSGTRVRPHAKFGLNRPAGCREIVDKKANKQKTHSKTNASPFALTSEWRVITDLYSDFRSTDTEAVSRIRPEELLCDAERDLLAIDQLLAKRLANEAVGGFL